MMDKYQKSCPNPYTVHTGMLRLLSRALSVSNSGERPLLIQISGGYATSEVPDAVVNEVIFRP
jgi:hypothetical protein